MVSSLLQKLKDSLSHQSHRKHEGASSEFVSSGSGSEQILEHLDTHGTVDKDLNVEPCIEVDSSVKQNRATQRSGTAIKRSGVSTLKPRTQTPPKTQADDVIDLSIFDEEPQISTGEEILAFVDAYGIETKASDTLKKSSTEASFYKTKKAHEVVVDLHGLRKEGAALRIKRAFAEAKTRGAGQLLIIHGRGNHSAGGVSPLKEMVYDLLGNHYGSQIKSYGFAPPHEGGGGATRVVLK